MTVLTSGLPVSPSALYKLSRFKPGILADVAYRLRSVKRRSAAMQSFFNRASQMPVLDSWQPMRSSAMIPEDRLPCNPGFGHGFKSHRKQV
jgi:hypothetical protein